MPDDRGHHARFTEGLETSSAEDLMTIFPDCGNTAIDPDDSLASDAPPPSVAVREDFGHLTLKKPLGTGAMGEVWLAYDERLSRSVAIKMLGKRLMHDMGAVTRFLDEAAAWPVCLMTFCPTG